MRVKDVMEKEVLCVSEEATYEEAARALYENKWSGAPVVDKEGNLVGIISEKDLFKAIFPNYSDYYTLPHAYVDLEKREGKVREVRSQPVSQFMSQKLFTIAPDDAALKAGAIMLARGVFRLPVVEGKKVVGLVTREHIYRAIFKKYLEF